MASITRAGRRFKISRTATLIRGPLVGGVIFSMFLHPACSGSSSGCDSGSLALKDSGTCWVLCKGFPDITPKCPNPAVPPAGPTFGLTSDDRINITAQQAWPDRPAPVPTPSVSDIADACAALAACNAIVPPGQTTPNLDLVILTQEWCVHGALSLSNTAERVIPVGGSNESWDFVIRGANAVTPGDCTAMRQLLTPRDPSIACEEDGCYSTSNTTVTCLSDQIARLGDITRDCSRAGMHCSATSPTGCTDRQLTRCESSAIDRCDGAIKLGCDHCGFVSYHDCSWNGGRCVETPGGAYCQDPEVAGDPCASAPRGCSGDSLSLCVNSMPVTVDCIAIGMNGCVDVPPDSLLVGCDPDATDNCPLAYCQP